MDKISRIIPANSRTKTVDVSSGQPVRPGAPSWGRPEGKVTRAVPPLEVQDRVSLSTADQALAASPATYKNRVAQSRAKSVEETSNKFFESNTDVAADEAGRSSSERALEAAERTDQVAPESSSGDGRQERMSGAV